MTIEVPAPGRYQITGLQVPSIYVEDVGWLAPPQSIDLPMTPDIADALRAILDDYQPGTPAAAVAPPPRKIIRRKVNPRTSAPTVQHEPVAVAQGGAA